MIKEVEVDIPAKKVKQFKEQICDICGKTTNEYDNWCDNVGEKLCITVAKTHTTNMYDGGGDVEETIFDICAECFDTKLVPFLESFGAARRTSTFNY